MAEGQPTAGGGAAPAAPSAPAALTPTRGNFRQQIASAVAATAPAAPAAQTPMPVSGPGATTQQPATVTPIRDRALPQPAPDGSLPEGSTPGWNAEMQELDRQVAERLKAEGQIPGEQPAQSEADPALTDGQPGQDGAPADGGPTIAGIPEAQLLEQLRGCVTQDGSGFVLPAELQERMFVTARHNGQDVVVPMADAARGIIRQNVLTQQQQQLATANQQIEQAKQNLRAFFQGWDDPSGQGLIQSLHDAGVEHVARAGLRQQWGSPEQPNVQGFLTDIQDSGYWGAFIEAARLYAQNYEERVAGFMHGTSNLPAEERARRRAHAKQMVDQLDHNDVQTMLLQHKTRAEAEQIKREQAKQLREQQLQAAQQQQQPQFDPGMMQHIAGMQDRAMQHFGIRRNAVSDDYFGRFLVAEINMARAQGAAVPPEELIARAAEATKQQIEDDRGAFGASAQPAGTAQQQVQQAAQQRPGAQPLPARPAAAPAASTGPAPGQLPRQGTNADFKRRIGMIQAAYKGR